MRTLGSVMLETVLVLPVFVFFVCFLIQATFVWTARQMTVYAAYCAARAALVYNPADYSSNDSGVAHKAACTVLSWISFSDKGSRPVRISANGGGYEVPCSNDIGNQVRVSVAEFSGDFPAVTATVDFKYPLVIPFGSIVFAYNPKPNGWDTGPKEGGLIASGDAAEEGSRQYLHIRESYTLAKPYKTETFPLAAAGDKSYLGIRNQDSPYDTSDPTDDAVPVVPLDEALPIDSLPVEPSEPIVRKPMPVIIDVIKPMPAPVEIIPQHVEGRD